MMRSMLRENSVYYPDGVVDTCIIVFSLFYNPLYELAVEFISKILAQEVNAAIPPNEYYWCHTYSYEVFANTL